MLLWFESGKLERDDVGDIDDGESSPFVSAALFDADLVVGVVKSLIVVFKKKVEAAYGQRHSRVKQVKGQRFGIRKAKAKNRMIYGEASVVLSTILCGSF
jgi:hypothetical protein